MKRLLIAALIAGLPFAAFAADDKPMSAQQNKMKECNAEAGKKSLKGDERRAFMKACLSAGREEKRAAHATAVHPGAKERMKTCNAEATAKGLKKDDRKKFMWACLSGK